MTKQAHLQPQAGPSPYGHRAHVSMGLREIEPPSCDQDGLTFDPELYKTDAGQ